MMFDLAIVLFTVVAVCFGFVLLFGAPYLPTLRPQQEAALKLLKLSKGGMLLELGCGDGRVLIAAAKKGYRATGFEINPLLAFIAWARTRQYKGQVSVVCGNFWNKEWPQTGAVFTFLIPKYMERLDKKIIQYKHKPVKLVSFAFPIPGKKIDRQEAGVFLYIYK